MHASATLIEQPQEQSNISRKMDQAHYQADRFVELVKRLQA